MLDQAELCSPVRVHRFFRWICKVLGKSHSVTSPGSDMFQIRALNTLPGQGSSRAAGHWLKRGV